MAQVSYFTDSDVVSYQDENWYGSGSSWLKVNTEDEPPNENRYSGDTLGHQVPG